MHLSEPGAKLGASLDDTVYLTIIGEGPDLTLRSDEHPPRIYR
jgi:hypothetical protein